MAACTDTSNADTGSSRTSRRGSSTSARAITTRCSCPPDSSCGPSPGERGIEAHRREHVGRCRWRRAVNAQRLGDLIAHAQPRVERTGGILIHQLHGTTKVVASPAPPAGASPARRSTRTRHRRAAGRAATSPASTCRTRTHRRHPGSRRRRARHRRRPPRGTAALGATRAPRVPGTISTAHGPKAAASREAERHIVRHR